MSQNDLFLAPKKGQFPTPREFQDVAHRELRTGFIEGHKRQMLMAPTGAGKTYLGLRLINESLARGKRALFICDRKTLIEQTSRVADSYGMPTHGIIQADNPRMALWRPFQIASAQTLALRGVTDDFDVIVVDEAHTQMEATTELITNTKAAVIGLSATPFSKGLGVVYSRVVNAATMDELVRSGVLTPMRVLSCRRPDMEGAKTSGGEWTAKAAAERGMTVIGDVVREWQEHAENRKTICFGSSVVHCEALAKQFTDAGIPARLFTGHTDDKERQEILEEYRKTDSKLRVLISVEALAKGFDVPDVGCVIDCRPLRKSLSTFVQMVGRGLRSSPGKTECLLLDHSGNVVRFAESFSDVYFNGLASLDTGEKLDQEVRKDEEHKAKNCPKCGYSPMGRRCVGCGFEPVVAAVVEHEHGRAEELDIFGTSKSAYAASPRDLYNAIATLEHARVQMKGHGNGKGTTAHRYREITGRWPPGSFDYDTAPTVTPSRALLGKLRSLKIAYVKSLAKGRRDSKPEGQS